MCLGLFTYRLGKDWLACPTFFFDCLRTLFYEGFIGHCPYSWAYPGITVFHHLSFSATHSSEALSYYSTCVYHHHSTCVVGGTIGRIKCIKH